MINTNFIKTEIGKRMMTQKEFSQLADIAETTLSRIMQTKSARPSTVIKIAKALDVDPAELIEESEV